MKNAPSTRILRRTGLARDQEGIYSRYLREKKQWEGHLRNTRNFIESCVSASGAKTIAVLGSGWCLDVPVDFLLEHSEQLHLVDLRHPRMVRNRYKKQRGISFSEEDLTGGMIDRAYQGVMEQVPLNELITLLTQMPPYALPFETDLVVSVNLLNQLDILLIDYLRGQYNVKADVLTELRRNIQHRHLDLLSGYDACLITDYEELQVDANNEVVQRHTNLFVELPASTEAKQWVWEFDTHRTYHPRYNTQLNVIAVKLPRS